eukprot:Partr_v1_DN15810_c0_g1_i1_m46822 putative CCR4-NOT transcription complex subunit 2
MLGLLSVIKLAGGNAGGGSSSSASSSERDLSVLALGTDLTSLGMALGSPDPLGGTFGHAYGDAPTARGEPLYSLPPCYRMPQPALKTGHLARFEAGTLLYIFHAMPRDLLQGYAAQELYGRGWRYHRDARAWFVREAASPSGWAVWDSSSWSLKHYVPPPGAPPGFA